MQSTKYSPIKCLVGRFDSSAKILWKVNYAHFPGQRACMYEG